MAEITDFKVGESVKTLVGIGSVPAGAVGEIVKIDSGDKTIYVKTSKDSYWYNPDQLQHVSKKDLSKPYAFLLQYDKDSDPLELFRTMKEVEERIKYLVENDRYVKRNSFKVYPVGKVQVVVVSTALQFKKS